MAETSPELTPAGDTAGAGASFDQPVANLARASVSTFPLRPGTVLVRQFVRLGERPREALATNGDRAPAGAVQHAAKEPNAYAEGAAAGALRAIYSNTLGRVAVSAGAGLVIADDIVITAPSGCPIRQFSFDVSGAADPDDPITGPYAVDFALYNTCPGAVSAAVRPSRIIVGTTGSVSFPDAAARMVVVSLATPVAIPSQVWLALTFSRNNAGPIMGAPAQEGYSQDLYHSPGFNCSVNLGGFPEGPHGSFNAQFWADAGNAACPTTQIGYLSHRETGGIYNPGADVWLLDDIELLTPDCRMVGFAVTVRGVGTYNFEFRESCDGAAIPGSSKSQIVPANNAETRNLTFAYDSPIPLTQQTYFGVRLNTSNSGVVVAGLWPEIGFTADQFFKQLSPDPAPRECEPLNAVPLEEDAFNLTVYCEGAAPTGACCDMYVRECAGGEHGGSPCYANSDCGEGGSCEVPCRVLPEANCTFPVRGFAQGPSWIEDATCDPEPFARTCGVSACCTPVDTCENLTKNDCDHVEPQGAPRNWRLGQFCEDEFVRCPFAACMAREGFCSMPHNGAGCDNPGCCHLVCEIDPLCCYVEWDEICVRLAAQTYDCRNTSPNRACWSTSPVRGATEIGSNSRTFFSDGREPELLEHPICCFDPPPNICAWAGEKDGLPCETDADCEPGCCEPNALELTRNWFKFVATRPAVQISTANEDSDGDPVLQVYAVGDPSSNEAACNSLTPIGCSDDCAECGEFSKQARLCLTGLTPGNLYYVSIGSKWTDRSSVIRLDITSGDDCLSEIPWSGDDCDGNGYADGCDLAAGRAEDCDRSSIPDACELRDEITFDCDLDALQDNCEPDAEPLEAPEELGGYGFAVAIENDVAFVADPSTTSIGQVHRYDRKKNDWNHAGTLLAPGSGIDDGFGSALAITADWLLVGAPKMPPNGAAYVFSSGVDAPTRSIVPRGDIDIAEFGRFIAAHQDRVVIGGRQSKSSSPLVLVYLFQSGEWTLEAELRPSNALGINDWIHSPIDIWDPWIAVNTEPISIFRRVGRKWIEQMPIEFYPSAEHSNGTSLVLQDNLLLVANCEARGPRRVLVPFRRDGSAWIPGPQIPTESYCQSAPSLALDGATAAMIAYRNSDLAQVFQLANGQWSVAGGIPLLPTPGCSVTRVSVALGGHRAVVGLVGSWWCDQTAGGSDPVSAYVASVPLSDCDSNGKPDECEFRDGEAEDCNGNRVPDECDDLAAFDSDFDGDRDLFDFGRMGNCFGGVGLRGDGPLSCCTLFDAPEDGQIGRGDYQGFIAAMSGP